MKNVLIPEKFFKFLPQLYNENKFKLFKIFCNYKKKFSKSILKPNTSNMRSFVSNAQTIAPIVLYHRTSGYSQQQIAIKKSLSVAQPLIVPIEKADQTCISLEDFFVLLDKRLLEEEAYIKEIIEIKNEFCEEFNQLYQYVPDKEFAVVVRNQRQIIIDYMFDLLKFEKRQLIGDFYDNIMDGYGDEVIKNLDKIVYNILWKPMLTPLPLGLTQELKHAIKNFKNTQGKQSIEEITSKMILFVKECLMNRRFKLSEIKNAKDLRDILTKQSNARKICSIDIDEPNENKLRIIQEFKSKCIKNISISLNFEEFNMKQFNFAFDQLNLQAPTSHRKFRQILSELPINLKSFAYCFTNAKSIDMKLLRMHLKNFTSLRMLALNFNDDSNSINDNGMCLISQLLNHNKRIKILKLYFEGCSNNITGEGLASLSIALIVLSELNHLELSFSGQNATIIGERIDVLTKSLQNLIKISHLYLNFEGSSITANAIDNLAISIKQLIQMTSLDLNFSYGNNSANNHSIKLFAQAISEMINLNHLKLNFGWGNNQITDDGITQLGHVITKLINIQQFILNFEYGSNGVTDKGIEELSQSIANLKSLQHLSLCLGGGNNGISDKGIEELSQSIAGIKGLVELDLRFFDGNHQISDKGMQAVAAALKKNLNLKKICLAIYYGKNTISRNGIKYLAEAIVSLNSPLQLACGFIGYPNTVTNNDIDYLGNARKYVNFWGNQREK